MTPLTTARAGFETDGAGSAPPRFNPQRMDELALEAGSDAIVRELVVLFLEDVSQRLQELEQAVKRSDRSARERVAHSIKGSAANLGAERLALLASAIEHCSNDEALTEIAGMAEEFEALKQLLDERYA